MTVTMESCPKYIDEITSAIQDLIYEFELTIHDIDHGYDRIIIGNDANVINPKFLIKLNDLNTTAIKIGDTINALNASEFFDMNKNDLRVREIANIKFYLLQISKLQSMVKDISSKMLSVEMNYFNRKNAIPYIRYYMRNTENEEKMDCDTASSNESKEDTSLDYIKTRSDRLSRVNMSERFNPNAKGHYETFEV